MNDSRGQAIVETAVMAPLFVLALFGTIWGIHAAVLSERVESSVRNAGIVLTHREPFHDYSLLSAYSGANNGAQAPAPIPCSTPTAQPLTGSSELNGIAGNPYFIPGVGTIYRRMQPCFRSEFTYFIHRLVLAQRGRDAHPKQRASQRGCAGTVVFATTSHPDDPLIRGIELFPASCHCVDDNVYSRI